jgi:transposase
MWLSAIIYHDHKTINRFRSDRFKGVLRVVFSQVVLLLKTPDMLVADAGYGSE